MTRALPVAGAAGLGFMASEILASRWLAPVHGFTLTTWSWLISATLLGGSVGAWWGGRLAEGAGPGRVGLGLLAAGAWLVLLAFAAPSLVVWTADLPGGVGAALASGLLVLPAVLSLGAIVPLLTATERAGPRLVGRLVAASTFGSLLGTLLTAHLGVTYLGLASSALVVAGLLAGAASLCLGGRRAVRRGLTLACLAGLAFALPLTTRAEEGRIRTPYGELTLRESPGRIDLRSDGVLQAALPRTRLRPLDLLRQRHYVELLPYLRPWGREALIVGLGGGLAGRALRLHGVRATWVEVNGALVDLLRRRGLAPPGEVVVADGRAYLRCPGPRYAFVVLDAFNGEALPGHLLTREAFLQARARLEPGGVLLVHLIGRPGHRVTAGVGRTLALCFREVVAVRSGVGEELQDVWLFASDGPLSVPPATELGNAGWRGDELFSPGRFPGPVFTDDRNPVESWNEGLARALRRRSR